MRRVLKISFISVLLSFSFSSFASNYVSVFKPSKQVKTLSEFKEDIQQDVLLLRTIMNAEDNSENLDQKKTIELVKYKTTNQKSPTEI